MRLLTFVLLFTSLPAFAQNADSLYTRACGSKDASFLVEQVKGELPTSPAPGKALVYVLQRETRPGVVTRIGVDGSWGGVVGGNSYIPLSVVPGEHHLCAATQDRKHPKVELVHFTAEAGKVYFYVVRTAAADTGSGITMSFEGADRDEALYLIASEPQSVAKPKP